MHSFIISGQLVDLFQKKIFPATINITNGIITSIKEEISAPEKYILPGFIDAHIHIESSMMVPAAFARLAVVHGTVATVSDPHEIANVCGVEGIEYMLNSSRQTPFKIFFGAPSCVPATSFETAGAHLDAVAIGGLLHKADIWYLSEMMNYPGVLNRDTEVTAKIEAAKKAGKPIDGHAPGLKGEEATAYIAAGISTDHECFTLDEALHKIYSGMHIIIREGSAAKNFDALCELLKLHPEKIMFCSDDKHPDELVMGHINTLVKRALDKGYDLFDVLRAACVNPVLHYNIPVGLLKVNDPADFIVVDNLNDFKVLQTYINGELVANEGKTLIPQYDIPLINHFSASSITIKDIEIKADNDDVHIRVIEAIEGQLITNELHTRANIVNGCLVADMENDILKIVIVNRYNKAPVAKAFIKNFGFKKGAIASTVAHDCHNIISVGTDDSAICAAINALIDCKGGISVAMKASEVHTMPLPVAGLMSHQDGYAVAQKYSDIDAKAKELGTHLKAPFMTLSFMALLVIPSLKLSDKGLFNGSSFEFTPIVLNA